MFKTIRDFNVKEKRILIRCDFNVPLNDDGSISDDFRIKKTLPTIEYLFKQKAKVILLTHLGEPEGKVIPLLKLDGVKARLEELLANSVRKLDDCVGPQVEAEVENVKPGEILLLENLRFHAGETDNDPEFAKNLARLGDIFINDAFGDCHRSHASMVLLPKFLPSGAGLLLEKEVANFQKVLENPQRPMVAVVGGSKVKDKAKFIEAMAELADTVIISGLIKKELTADNSEILQNPKVLGPKDDLGALDISEEVIKTFIEKIADTKTVVWNGPFGKFEEEKYRKGTLAIAKAIIKSKAFSVVGGGETIEFLNREGLISKFSWVSTGGGAMLDYLVDGALPGLDALGVGVS